MCSGWGAHDLRPPGFPRRHLQLLKEASDITLSRRGLGGGTRPGRSGAGTRPRRLGGWHEACELRGWYEAWEVGHPQFRAISTLLSPRSIGSVPASLLSPSSGAETRCRTVCGSHVPTGPAYRRGRAGGGGGDWTNTQKAQAPSGSPTVHGPGGLKGPFNVGPQTEPGVSRKLPRAEGTGAAPTPVHRGQEPGPHHTHRARC